jgi:trehalose 6-phosphate synthase
LLFAQPHDNSQHRVVAALEMAAATLVNPTYDGLNLVAMESLLLAPAAPVVLSVNAGVHDVLAPYVLDVDPFDIVATTNAIAVALESSSLSGGQWPGGQIRSAEAWLRELLA